MGVTTIDDNVTFLEERFKLGNEAVDRITCFDEENDLAGGLEFGAELLDGMCSLDIGTCIDIRMKTRENSITKKRVPLASWARNSSTLLVVRL